MPDGAECGVEVLLPQQEAHHALHVVRVRQGDAIELFDGCGRVWQGRIASATKRDVIVAVDSETLVPPPRPPVDLFQAALDNDKAAQAVVKTAAELGVRRVVFFRGRRSQRPFRAGEKWDRVAVEACKQCGNAWLPRIEAADSLEEVLQGVGKDTPPCPQQAEGPEREPAGEAENPRAGGYWSFEGGGTRPACRGMFSSSDDPDAPQHPQRLLIATPHLPPIPLREAVMGAASVAVLVGPEGEFSPEELKLSVEAGGIPISLGDSTFRAEVAVSHGLALTLYELGRMGLRP